jgi:hypothetical protein
MNPNSSIPSGLSDTPPLWVRGYRVTRAAEISPALVSRGRLEQEWSSA